MTFIITDDLTDEITTITGDYEDVKEKIWSLAGTHYVEVLSNGKIIDRFYVENLG